MVTTPPLVGFVSIYDYLTDGDMDIQEEAGKDKGADFCRGAPINLKSTGKLDFDKEIFYGGEGYGFRYDAIERIVTGVLEVTEEDLADIYEYYYKHKDNGSSKDYLCFRKGAGDFYDGFFNKSGGNREYCEGFLTFVNDNWTHTRSNLYEIMFVFEEVLSG